MQMILGLLKPTEGEIYINHKDNDPIDQSYLHNKSYIPQSFHCYPVSLIENITFEKDNPETHLCDRMEKYGSERLIPYRHEKYGLAYGGLELSGGQKQRISIIRGANKKADVILFDEPTSAIDPMQEGKIYDNILELIKGKTAIMISHRLALARYSDRIIVLKQGEIIEKGTHHELLREKGEYYKMWSKQAKLYH